MTSEKILANNKRYSVQPYFRFYLKQNWQQMVLFLILALFIMLVPSYIAIQQEIEWIERVSIDQYYNMTQNDIIERTQSNMETVSIISLFLCGGLALISGMSAMSYVNSKKSVGCYHSFPVKRESLYIIETVTSAIYFLVSIFAGYILSYLMFLLSVDGCAEYTQTYFTVMCAGIVLYSFIYTAILLAGSLTGTHVMKFILFLILLFLPVAVYLLTMSLVGANSSINESYYISTEAIRFLAPIIDLIYDLVLFIDGSTFAWVSSVCLSVVMYVAAMVLNKFRKSELSGTTVVWKPVFYTVKYVVIASAALLGTWVGYYIGDTNIVTGVLGMMFGGLIGLALMNSIMYRSTRAMFKDFKYFLVCMGITFVFIILVPFNVTGIIGRPYSVSTTKSVTIKINDNVVFEDKESIEEIVNSMGVYNDIPLRDVRYIYSDDEETMLELASDFKEWVYMEHLYDGNGGYYTAYGEYYNEYGNRVTKNDIEADKEAFVTSKLKAKERLGEYNSATTSHAVIQRPYFGIPLAKTVSFDINGATWNNIINSEEFIEQYNLPQLLEKANYIAVDFNILGFGNTLVFRKDNIDNTMLWNILDKCIFDPKNRENSVLVGWVYINFDISNYSGNRKSIYYPVYSCDIELINAIGECWLYNTESYREYSVKYDIVSDSYGDDFTAFKTEDDVIDYIVDSVSSLALVDVETAEAVVIKDKEQITTLLGAASSTYNVKWSVQQFSLSADTDYIIITSFENNSTSKDHFRPGAIDNTQLEAMFNANK